MFSEALERGEFQKAFEHYQKALEIFQRTSNPLGEADTLFNIGVAYLNLKRYEKAIEFFTKAKEKYSILGMEHAIQKVNNNIKIINNRQK